ncbi:CYTH and CHAD domain-containing protein [Dermatophilaceae bacterium Soc4.6]
MPPTSHLEIERKFDVPYDSSPPDLQHLPGVEAAGPTSTFHLAADYWDTRRHHLARHQITLRRRTGGTDAGWHLKVGAGVDGRAEHACELGDATAPPEALVDLVRHLVLEHPLQVVARVDTHRDETPLLDGAGRVLAWFCDDLVVSDTPPSSGHGAAQTVGATLRPDRTTPGTSHWREWEVELADGDRHLLAATSTALIAGGAQPPVFASKLAHALGDRLPITHPGRPGRGHRRGRHDRSASDVLGARLHSQLDALTAQADGVAAGDPTAVHDMRIATRRLRAALRTFEPVLETGATTQCTRELRWLGLMLGSARDAQVLRERLEAELAALPGGLDRGPAAARIDAHLGRLAGTGQAHTAQAVTSDRYHHLLDELETLATLPPARPEAAARAKTLVPGLLARDARRFLRASRRAGRALPPGRDVALHEVRKRAKQLRYSAESVTPVCGKRARKVARAATRVQESLGAHQDAVVARQVVRDLTTQARTAGEDLTPYDAVSRVERAAAARAVEAYDQDLRHLRKVLRRRLGGLLLAHR